MAPQEVTEELALVYHLVIRTFVETGRAPHYTELARAMGVEAEHARDLLHELMSMRMANWLYPGTDIIASLAPFSNLPNHHRVSVNGRQLWFAQCGLESLAISYLFPRQLVQVESACLDCGELVRLSMRDGALLELSPTSAVGHVNTPVADWYADVAAT